MTNFPKLSRYEEDAFQNQIKFASSNDLSEAKEQAEDFDFISKSIANGKVEGVVSKTALSYSSYAGVCDFNGKVVSICGHTMHGAYNKPGHDLRRHQVPSHLMHLANVGLTSNLYPFGNLGELVARMTPYFIMDFWLTSQQIKGLVVDFRSVEFGIPFSSQQIQDQVNFIEQLQAFLFSFSGNGSGVLETLDDLTSFVLSDLNSSFLKVPYLTGFSISLDNREKAETLLNTVQRLNFEGHDAVQSIYHTKGLGEALDGFRGKDFWRNYRQV